MLTRRAAALTPVAVLLLAAIGAHAGVPPPAATPLSAEDRALADQAAVYLQGLGEVKGRFEQTGPRGGVARGDLYLNRPGRARFVYDPPSNLLVVANGRTVFVADPRLKTVSHYPLSATPLSLFLARQVRLDSGVAVSRVQRFSDGYSLTLSDARRRVRGEITLTFSSQPMRLQAWSLTDGQGQTTRVKLTGLEPVSGLDPALFAGPDIPASGAAPDAR